MSVKKVLSTGLVTILFAFIGLQVHAFVDPDLKTAFLEDTTAAVDLIAELNQNLRGDSVVSKIDDMIDSLDAALDSEPDNELELMQLRDVLVELRAKAVDQAPEQTPETMLALVDGVATAPAIAPAIASGGGYAPACAVCQPSGSTSGAIGGGGFSIGGSGLLNPRRLLLIGGLVAGLASLDGDDEVEIQSI